MTAQRKNESVAFRKLKSGLNLLGRRLGAVPREYLYVNEHELCVRHRHTKADIESILQCLVRKQYEIPEIRGALAGAPDRYYSSLIEKKRRPLIIDGGANIGASALWFATRFPNSHIVAIEPAPDNFALLCENVQGLDVETRQVGLNATGGRATLLDPGYGPWSYRTGPASDDGELAMITLRRLLTSVASEQSIPFILKLDIEGSEAGIFDGADNPAQLFPIIIIEPHDWMLPAEGTSHSFFRFHLESGRDFLSRGENVFSLDFARLRSLAHLNEIKIFSGDHRRPN